MTAQQIKSEMKLRWWPTPQDYNEAVQNPATSFEDAELKGGEIFVGPLGLPVPVCGAFASVYRMRSGNRELALRCFLRSVDDQEHRYAMISNFIRNDDLSATVDFEFERRGIQINGQWFPVLKMEWVAGQTLDQFIASHLDDGHALNAMAGKFLDLYQNLQRLGIAHGDLQHGNIMVADGEIRLVDYDGMYVPEMYGLYANELGHRNYQHPKRFDAHFGPYLDNFAAWVIYTSLRALAVAPELYRRMGAGDDCLLFKAEDFQSPRKSAVFKALESHQDEGVRRFTRMIRANLNLDPSNVPPLIESPPDVELAELDSESCAERGDWNQVHVDVHSSRAAAIASLPRSTHLQGQFVFSTASSSSVEPELTMPCPRAVRLEPTLKPYDHGPDLLVMCLILVIPALNGNPYCVAALIVCLLLMFQTTLTPASHRSLASHGVAGAATITGSERKGNHYFVKYEFMDASGEKVSARDRIPAPTQQTIWHTRQTVTVLYDETNPRNCVLYSNCMYKAV